LTTDLSRIEHMRVISRETAFAFKGKPIDTKQIGRELGVRYLLEGSVQRSGNHVRVNVQLIDAETNAHLWADRFDRDIGDLFTLQNGPASPARCSRSWRSRKPVVRSTIPMRSTI
jgi:TolB-like protein